MDKKLYILIGVPASGKSTWRDEFAKQRPDAIICSTDDEIEAYAARLGITYDEAFNDHIGNATSAVNATFRQSLRQNAPIIVVDRTNLTPKSRKQWIQPAKKAGYDIIAVSFRPPTTPNEMKEWNRRLRNREGKTIPRNVLDSMMESFNLPQPEEGWDRVGLVNTWSV